MKAFRHPGIVELGEKLQLIVAYASNGFVHSESHSKCVWLTNAIQMAAANLPAAAHSLIPEAYRILQRRRSSHSVLEELNAFSG